MTRALALQAGIGIMSGIAGLALLRRRAITPQGAYAARIAGMMLVALCLFLTGFALVFSIASAA